MKNLILLLSLLLIGNFGNAQQNLSGLTESYISLKNDLIESNAAAAQNNAKEFYSKLLKSNDFSKKSTLMKLSKQIFSSVELTVQRKAFNDISIELWKLLKADNKIVIKLYYAYCPMKKMYWISETKEIKNPYYGSSMLNCGSIKDSIN